MIQQTTNIIIQDEDDFLVKEKQQYLNDVNSLEEDIRKMEELHLPKVFEMLANLDDKELLQQLYKVTPCHRIVSFNNQIEGTTSNYILQPKFLALGYLHITERPLTGVNSFVNSLIRYNETFSGLELAILIKDKRPSEDIENIHLRIAAMFRKFLCYQFIIFE